MTQPAQFSKTADGRKLANLLMVGHGAALLLIFNARVQNAITNFDMRFVAGMFAFGLLAAALCFVLLILRDEQAAELKSAIAADRKLTAKMRDLFMATAEVAIIASMGTFVMALLVGILMIGPEAPSASPSAPAAVSSGASPSTAAVESSARP